MARLLIFSAFWVCTVVNAQSFTEDFSTLDRRGSGDLIWNFQMGYLHAPLTVYGWDYTLAAPAPADREVDVGTGEHGVFDSTTYAQFDQDGDSGNNIIEINTDDYQDGLKVTRFQLDFGYTLRPTGNAPLMIKSLSDIIIAGTIDCSGDDGATIGAVGTNPQGGRGRCGGADGGNGGSGTLAATAGGNAAGTVTGGDAGLVSGASGGAGGGGGGSFNLVGATPDDGEDPNAALADDGADGGDVDATDAGFGVVTLGGGGGGGGGAPSTNGTDDSSGGGGGAGGGVIVLVAYNDIQIANGGLVKANGGSGGGGGASQDGGAGGGGGGGSIAMFAGGAVINDQFLGVTADGGARGTTTNVTNGGSHGGNGTDGRIWMTDQDGSIVGGGSEPAYANVLIGLGEVLPREGTHTAISDPIELHSSSPLISTVNLTSQTDVNNSVTVEFATSADAGFPAPTWTDSALWAGTNASRFIRFKVTIDIGDRTQLEGRLQTLSFTYERLFQTQFDFKGGCGLIMNSSHPQNPHHLLGLIVVLLPLLTFVGLQIVTRRSPL